MSSALISNFERLEIKDVVTATEQIFGCSPQNSTKNNPHLDKAIVGITHYVSSNYSKYILVQTIILLYLFIYFSYNYHYYYYYLEQWEIGV